jgi:hypothetical protein
MLNDHTASSAASMTTSCLDLNGGSNPSSESLVRASRGHANAFVPVPTPRLSGPLAIFAITFEPDWVHEKLCWGAFVIPDVVSPTNQDLYPKTHPAQKCDGIVVQ